MLSQQKTDSFSRTVSSLTLDGRRLTADVSVFLHRPLARSDADALAGEVATIIDDILGGQIVQGQAPLSAGELESLALTRTKALGKIAKIRVSSLRLAVPAATSATPVRGIAPAAPNRPTPTPSADSPVSQRVPMTPAPPSMSPRPRYGAPSVAPAAVTPSRRPLVTPSAPPVVPASQRQPVASAAPASPDRYPPASARPSPSLAPNFDSEGEALAGPLRDAVATALLAILSVATSTAIDRLALLEGTAATRDLCREASACFVAGIYRASIAAGESHKVAVAKVESACRYAFPAHAPSATEIGLYISGDAPAAELAGRVGELLGSESDSAAIRAAVMSSYSAFAQRLARQGSARGLANP